MRTLFALALISLCPAALRAQDRADVAQIPSVAEPAVPMPPPPGPADDGSPQLSDNRDSSPNQAQLTAVSSSPEQPSQVGIRSRDPRAPQPLSTPEEGRTAAIEPVSGHDKCDPATSKEKSSTECRKIIENRAAEYRRAPVTELSPEQKLLIDQQLRENAAQQLAKSGDPANNSDAMGIAAIILRNNSELSKPSDEKEPGAQSEAAVQAVISVLQGTAPQD